MATLFDRLSGLNLPDDPVLDEEKIPIHAYVGLIVRFLKGFTTGTEIKDAFNLSVSQTSDSVALKNKFASAPDKTEFRNVVKEWLYCAETSTPGFTDESVFIADLDAEIVRQGGTP